MSVWISLSVLSAISKYSGNLTYLTLSIGININRVSDPKIDIKKDSCEPGWWGFLSWQINVKQTTPPMVNFYWLQTPYVVLGFYKSPGDGDYPAFWLGRS